MRAGEFGTLAPSYTPNAYAHYTSDAQAGGLGTSANWPSTDLPGQGTASMNGNPSPQGFAGGAGGVHGTNNYGGGSVRRYGGGGGGGGGAGPFGNGGAGGKGADGETNTASLAPSAGTSAAANSGAGGGGGGAAGGAPSLATPGAAPGNGGSGRFRLVYFIPAVNPN